jgi:hypothetical protein
MVMKGVRIEKVREGCYIRESTRRDSDTARKAERYKSTVESETGI